MTALPSISEFIWDKKYRMKLYDGTPVDQTIDDTWWRVAKALAACEKTPEAHAQRFYEIMAVPRAAEGADDPQARDEELHGSTYKLKWPGSGHAIYVTINDVVDPQSLQRRPFELFINSKNMEHYAWTVALTRMVSAIFRRPHDSRFVVEELKAVFDPKGGAWVNGEYVPSVLAAIGGVIEKHMKAIGYPDRTVTLSPELAATQMGAKGLAMPDNTTGLVTDAVQSVNTDRAQLAALMQHAKAPPNCPSCGSFNLKFENGCPTCVDCGDSKCG